MSIVVTRSDYWMLPESERDASRQAWLDHELVPASGRKRKNNSDQPLVGKTRESFIRSAYSRQQSLQWGLSLRDGWGFSDVTLKDQSLLNEIGYAKLWRLLQHGDASTETLSHLAGRYGTPQLPPSTRKSIAPCISAALGMAEWLDHGHFPRTSTTPMVSESDTVLAVVLTVSNLRDLWHEITCRYHSDLRKAEDDPLLAEFLPRLKSAFRVVAIDWPTGTTLYHSYFTENLSSRRSYWDLCRDVNQTWCRYHKAIDRVWELIDDLTPWFDIQIDDDLQTA